MAQPKAYKFYLRGYIGGSWRYYYIDSSDTFADTITQTELERAPDGWQEMELEWERGFTYFGMFTAFTAPLKFVKDGAKILRHLHYTEGIEAICEIWVEKFNPSTYAYETFFKADLDFSTMVDEYDFVSVAIMENGFPAKLKAREDTPYEIEINQHASVQWIKHDGISLQAKVKHIGSRGSDINEFPVLSYFDTEGVNFAAIPYDQDGTTDPDQAFIRNNLATDLDVIFSVDYNLAVHGTGGAFPSSGQLRVILSTWAFGGGSTTDTVIETNATSIPFNVQTNVSGNILYSYTIPSGNVVQLSFEIVDYGTTTHIATSTYVMLVNGLAVYTLFDNRYESTYLPCLKAMDVYASLIDQISDGDVTDINSTILETTYLDMFYFLSGDAIRGLSNSVLKITFRDFFKWVNVHFGAAFYYTKSDNSVHLDHKESAYSYAGGMGFVISSVNNAKITPFTSELFTNLNIGCGEYDYDSKGVDNEISNGKFEYNVTSKWLSPMVRAKGIADYVTTIRTDIHGIELIRINTDTDTISDGESDNTIFVIHAETSTTGTHTNILTGQTVTYREIFREPIVVGTYELENIHSAETAYNVIFTPTQNIFRNGNWFRSLLKMNDNDELVYQTSAKTNSTNVKLQIKVGGVVVFDEGLDILIADLCDDGDELFLPFVIEFETREEINIYNLIESTPYDYIEFVLNGENQLGFIISVASKPALRGTTRFKLLLGRDTDLTTLIR